MTSAIFPPSSINRRVMLTVPQPRGNAFVYDLNEGVKDYLGIDDSAPSSNNSTDTIRRIDDWNDDPFAGFNPEPLNEYLDQTARAEQLAARRQREEDVCWAMHGNSNPIFEYDDPFYYNPYGYEYVTGQHWTIKFWSRMEATLEPDWDTIWERESFEYGLDLDYQEFYDAEQELDDEANLFDGSEEELDHIAAWIQHFDAELPKPQKHTQRRKFTTRRKKGEEPRLMVVHGTPGGHSSRLKDTADHFDINTRERFLEAEILEGSYDAADYVEEEIIEDVEDDDFYAHDFYAHDFLDDDYIQCTCGVWCIVGEEHAFWTSEAGAEHRDTENTAPEPEYEHISTETGRKDHLVTIEGNNVVFDGQDPHSESMGDARSSDIGVIRGHVVTVGDPAGLMSLSAEDIDPEAFDDPSLQDVYGTPDMH